MNLITFILIYIPMFFLLYRCINPKRPGLLRLFRISRDLKEAAAILRDKDYGSDLEYRIRNGSIDVAEEIFSTKILISQMEQYCDRIHSMQLHPNDKCKSDIDEYFNYDLLEQQGKIELCEHTANGMTALGLLGTFIGLTSGLGSFGKENSTQILAGISGLLDGMNTAFITSILGIILSLVLGYLLRIIVSDAERHLNQFLTNFHNNVMRNQTETAFNELIKHIITVESSLTASNDIQLNALDQVVCAFIAKLNADLELQIERLQAAMHDMSVDQQAHNSAIEKLITQMQEMGNQLNRVSGSFQPVLTNTNSLAKQIKSANNAMQQGLDQIHTMISNDAALFSRQKELADELLRASQSMEKVAASVQGLSVAAVKNADAVTVHCESLAKSNLQAMTKCLQEFNQTAEAVNNSIRNHGAQSIDTLHQHAQKTISQLPQTGISSAQVNTMLQQNQMILENQEQLLRLIEQSMQTKKAKRSWRSKK